MYPSEGCLTGSRSCGAPLFISNIRFHLTVQLVSVGSLRICRKSERTRLLVTVATMPLLPNIQWAQRKDRLYLTIDLQNAKDPTIKLDNPQDGKHGHVIFKGKAQSHATGAEAHDYEVELDLFGAINSEESKISISDRSVLLVIAKQDSGASKLFLYLLA